MTKVKHFVKHMDKNMWMATIAIVAILVVGGLVYANHAGKLGNLNLSMIFGGASDQAIANKAVAYINNNGLSQTPVTLTGPVTEESGLVKFKIEIGTNSFDSYATKDGKLLFPQVFEMDTKSATTPAAAAAAPATQTEARARLHLLNRQLQVLKHSLFLAVLLVCRCSVQWQTPLKAFLNWRNT